MLPLLLFSCAPEPPPGVIDDPTADTWAWDLPPGFPEPWVPEDNPMSKAKVELGRHLFYDTRLSGNQTQSCASCHDQALAFTDGKAQAEGSTGEQHRRSSMSLTNVGYYSALTWANPVLRTLEDQALVPMFGEFPVELGLSGMEEELLERLSGTAWYPELFATAFPEEEEPVSLHGIVRALASFERSLVSYRSPYDNFWYAGAVGAMSDEAKAGQELFFSERLECFHCHGGANFSDSSRFATSTFDELFYHNTGLYDVDGEGSYPARDQGLYELTQEPSDMGRFRAPSLRNVAVSAPYMHDGSVATLDEVIDHYAAGGRTLTEGEDAGVGSENPYKSEFMVGFELDEAERAQLLAFLDSLTDEAFLSDPAHGSPTP